MVIGLDCIVRIDAASERTAGDLREIIMRRQQIITSLLKATDNEILQEEQRTGEPGNESFHLIPKFTLPALTYRSGAARWCMPSE
ncbi:hypothetical protein KSD_72310 [Ktedonobacter sp. SOSP1-85]|nr:hypothetical protein KSD_72310 [Ktedonobacter sp. SOSP1-85]